MCLLNRVGKSTPPQNCHLNILVNHRKQYVDDFRRKLTFSNRLIDTSCEVRSHLPSQWLTHNALVLTNSALERSHVFLSPAVDRGRENLAHRRQSHPDSGLGLQVKSLKFSGCFPFVRKRQLTILNARSLLNSTAGRRAAASRDTTT